MGQRTGPFLSGCASQPIIPALSVFAAVGILKGNRTPAFGGPAVSRLFLLAVSLIAFLAFAAPPQRAAPKRPGAAATPAETLRVKKDFKVELLYSVPKEHHGSWVNLCTDPKGRLITSDQY